MSIQAITWALEQDLAKSSEKFVLVALSNYADVRGIAYPSVERLIRDTSQNRKTVLGSLKALAKHRMIQDTGHRVGLTGGVIVWRLVGLPENSCRHYVYRLLDPGTGRYYLGRRSCNVDPAVDEFGGVGKWVAECEASGALLLREVIAEYSSSIEAGAAWLKLMREAVADEFCMTPEPPRRRTSFEDDEVASGTKSGTASSGSTLHQSEPGRGTENGLKRSQKRIEAVPKTGHRTVINPSSNHQTTKPSSPAAPAKARAAKPDEKPGTEYPAEFLAFWEAYPRKQGKLAAFKRWEAAIKIIVGTRADAIATLLAGAQRYAKEVAAQKLEATKVKMAEGWLNAGRWDDEDIDLAAAANVPLEWWKATPGYEAKAKSLSIALRGNDEPMLDFRVRVLVAAGPGAWRDEELAKAERHNAHAYVAQLRKLFGMAELQPPAAAPARLTQPQPPAAKTTAPADFKATLADLKAAHPGSPAVGSKAGAEAINRGAGGLGGVRRYRPMSDGGQPATGRVLRNVGVDVDIESMEEHT